MNFPSATRHEMKAPFPNMDGKKIRLLTTAGPIIGEIVTSPSHEQKTFGIRVDVLINQTLIGPGQTRLEYTSWDMPKAAIASISETGDAEVPFQVEMPAT